MGESVAVFLVLDAGFHLGHLYFWEHSNLLLKIELFSPLPDFSSVIASATGELVSFLLLGVAQLVLLHCVVSLNTQCYRFISCELLVAFSFGNLPVVLLMR